MLNKVRKFLRDRSPDWLNTEVNKDLLQNLTGNINCSPRPSLGEGLGERADLQNDRQLLTANCSLMTVKGTPHWRRINQVFQTLNTAPENATYNQLIEYVKETTGVGCSRKLISKWKKQNTSHEFPDQNSEDYHLEQSTENAIAFSPTSTISSVNSFQFTETLNNSTNNNSLSTKKLITVKTWSYLTAAGLMASLVGCEIIPLNNNRLTENVAFARTSQGGEPGATHLNPQSQTSKVFKQTLKSQIKLNICTKVV